MMRRVALAFVVIGGVLAYLGFERFRRMGVGE